MKLKQFEIDEMRRALREARQFVVRIFFDMRWHESTAPNLVAAQVKAGSLERATRYRKAMIYAADDRGHLVFISPTLY